MHEPSRDLEVEALATGSGRDEELGTVRFPERINFSLAFLVPLAADDDGGPSACTALQITEERGYCLDGLGEEHNLFHSRISQDTRVDLSPLCPWVPSEEVYSLFEKRRKLSRIGLPTAGAR